MTGIRCILPAGVALAAIVAADAATAPAWAYELCVLCAEPDRTYRCRVKAAQGLEDAIRLYCVVKMAKDGGHKSCAVANRDAAGCDGPIKTYSLEGLGVPKALRQTRHEWQQQQQAPPELPGAPRLVEPEPKDGQPKTLVQMTGKTGKKIGEFGVKAGKQVGEVAVDTGSAIGKAARFTYNCVASLFRDCSRSSDQQDQQ